jgi:hypothetical protein
MRWVGHVECMRQIRTGMFKPLVLYWNHKFSQVFCPHTLEFLLVQGLLFLIHTSAVLWLFFFFSMASEYCKAHTCSWPLLGALCSATSDFSWRLQFFVCCLFSLSTHSVIQSCYHKQEYMYMHYLCPMKKDGKHKKWQHNTAPTRVHCMNKCGHYSTYWQ